MQKQIEEMAKEIEKSYTAYRGFCPHNTTVCSTVRNCMYCNIATHLIEQGYQKIPEGAVVLTKEEREEFNELYRSALQRAEKWERLCGIKIKETRKETAEKFAERLKEKLEENSPVAGYDLEDLEFDGETIQECIDEICKELTEGEL
jgi:type I site-specific restriction endonuclease